MKNWISKHSLLIYFTLAFLWSWSWWFGLIFTTPADAFASGNLPFTFIVFALIGGFGPSISGIITSLITGRRKETSFPLSGIKKGKFGIRWYAMAILTVPFLTLVQTGLHVISGRIVTYNVPDMMMILGFIWPLFSSFGEEIGWRGYALPVMQKRSGILPASLLLGLIWGLWHLPSDYIAYSSYGWLVIPMFLLLGPVTLTAHSVIMTFIFNKTKGSLIPMIIYHYTITMAGILSPSFSFNGPADDITKVAVSVGVIVLAAVLIIIFSRTMRNKQPDRQNDLVSAMDS